VSNGKHGRPALLQRRIDRVHVLPQLFIAERGVVAVSPVLPHQRVFLLSRKRTRRDVARLRAIGLYRYEGCFFETAVEYGRLTDFLFAQELLLSVLHDHAPGHRAAIVGVPKLVDNLDVRVADYVLRQFLGALDPKLSILPPCPDFQDELAKCLNGLVARIGLSGSFAAASRLNVDSML